MKVSDLMIGDWVCYNAPNQYYTQVREIRFTTDGDLGFIRGLRDTRDRLWTDANDSFVEDILSPVHLTQEILEKNGWVRTKYAYGRDCMEIHGADKLPEGVDNALSMARWSIDKNYQYHFLDLYMWKGSVMQHNVHYVHQLQHALNLVGLDKKIAL